MVCLISMDCLFPLYLVYLHVFFITRDTRDTWILFSAYLKDLRESLLLVIPVIRGFCFQCISCICTYFLLLEILVIRGLIVCLRRISCICMYFLLLVIPVIRGPFHVIYPKPRTWSVDSCIRVRFLSWCVRWPCHRRCMRLRAGGLRFSQRVRSRTRGLWRSWS